MNGIPEKLYKYVPAARVDILKNLNIRFTQPSALNDPFEFNLLFTEVVSVQELRDHYPKINIEEVMNAEINKLPEHEKAALSHLPKEILYDLMRANLSALFETPILDNLHRDHIKPHTDNFKNVIGDAFNRLIGILSLSSDPCSPPMWASYAENSKGFAVEFDASANFFNRRRSESDEFYHLRKVIYEDRMSSGPMSEIASDIFVHKSLSWKYENEWRMLVPLETADRKFTTPEGDDIFLFDYPPSLVSGIVFGLNTSEQTIEIVKEIISQNSSLSHVEFKKVIKGSVGFELDPF
jgi:hypothetical protein